MVKITDYTAGNGVKSSENNNNEIALFTQSGLQLIETLTDRSITYSKGQNAMVGEAYVSAAGQQASVDAGSTTAIFMIDKYAPIANLGTLENKAVVTDANTGSTFTSTVSILNDGIFTELATKSTSVAAGTLLIKDSLGATIVDKTISAAAELKWVLTQEDYSRPLISGETITIKYTGTNLRYTTSLSYSGTNFSYSSTPTPGTATNTTHVYAPITSWSAAEIYHDIDSGIFKPTISSGFLCCKVENWEDGAGIDFKVINLTEDSGWIEGTYDGDEIVWPKEEFTAFAGEPTQYVVRLKPKSTSPTAGVPAIYGSSVLLL